VPFEWDVDLLSGYKSSFLDNRSRRPATNRFFGCDTPGVDEAIGRGGFDAFMVSGLGREDVLAGRHGLPAENLPVLIRGDSQLAGRRRAPLRLAKELVYPRLLGLFDGFLYVGRRNHDYLRHYGLAEERLFVSPHCCRQRLVRRAGRRRSPSAR